MVRIKFKNDEIARLCNILQNNEQGNTEKYFTFKGSNKTLITHLADKVASSIALKRQQVVSLCQNDDEDKEMSEALFSKSDIST